MAAHYHVALGRTLTNDDDRRSATSNPRLGGLKSMRANRHHCAPKSLDSCRAKPERETQPEGAHDSPPTARRCRPNPSERADHAASARPREYGGISLPFQTVQHLSSYPQCRATNKVRILIVALQLGADLVMTGPQTRLDRFQTAVHRRLGMTLPSETVLDTQIGNALSYARKLVMV